MNGDWKDLLKIVQDSLPEGEEMPQQSETKEDVKPRLDIYFEKKGRGGKQATIITGFNCADDELHRIASKIKQKLGAGGSARCGEILIQGDRRTSLPKILSDLGYKSRVI